MPFKPLQNMFLCSTVLLLLASCSKAWSPLAVLKQHTDTTRLASEVTSDHNRRQLLFKAIPAALAVIPTFGVSKLAVADDTTTSTIDNYDTSTKTKISDQELRKIVTEDILDRQFLATGRLTQAVYRPTATFTDEIDTYKLDQWVAGTQKLFVGEKSKVRLVGNVDVNKDRVEFRFDEDLMFNIPFKPTVSLSGKVVLERDDDGYITSYREIWDQDVFSVLKTAKF